MNNDKRCNEFDWSSQAKESEILSSPQHNMIGCDEMSTNILQ